MSLDDEVKRFILECPEDHGAPLGIRYLLSHTSGLREAFLLVGVGHATR
jgi:CubicO group peptidase (beta-lactamase class C family)